MAVIPFWKNWTNYIANHNPLAGYHRNMSRRGPVEGGNFNMELNMVEFHRIVVFFSHF